MITDEDKQIVIDICQKVGGAISDEEALFLYKAAKEVERGVIVEIGAAHGKSTISLAMGSKAGYDIKVYSIDPHAGGMYTPDPTMSDITSDGTPDIAYYTGQGKSSWKLIENMLKFDVANIVVPLIDYSELAYKNFDNGRGWNLPIGLLFIDGDHRLNYVRKDIELWAKHVIGGGKILFHDKPFPGVSKVFEELISNTQKYCDIRDVGKDPIVNVTVIENMKEGDDINGGKCICY